MKFHNIRAIILFTDCTSGAIASRICGEQSSGSKSAATEVSATNSVSLIAFILIIFLLYFSLSIIFELLINYFKKYLKTITIL